MMGDFVGKGIDILIIMEFFFLSLGWILALAIPMSVLVASLMAYGRLAQDNEFAVMQASGVSILKIMSPSIIMGILLSWGMLNFNNYILPEMNHKNKLLSRSIQRKKPLAIVEPGFFINDIPGIIIKAEDVDREKKLLKKVILIQKNQRESARRTITAEEGKVYFDEKTSYHNFEFFNGELSNLDLKNSDQYQSAKFSKLIFRVLDKKSNFTVSESSHYSDREKSADSLRSKIARLKRKNGSKKTIGSIEVELYKKYSISFACLIFVLIGAPLGLMSGKSGLGASAVLSIVIFVIYWVFLMSGEDFADRGLLNPIFAMWNANIIIGFLGLIMMWQASRGAKISFTFLRTWFETIKSIFSRGKNV
jgi:lipopolysaccharide export system permease protein